ncbi:hypothetical protein NG42_05130 [Winslowiella iniecta]|uniref:Uncharacterized protein n=1 Tax=Winslowiella iniecta TaxID=1560201 RepID=A0A0L7T8A9_9GAMM|nr:hypothetical protein NG42_05130 [Winslowiella iniecta]KOC94427.1 hypothetical protein NG43_04375 [Winslowiella iniecta]
MKGGLNLYQYPPNPLSWIDPFGLAQIFDSDIAFLLIPEHMLAIQIIRLLIWMYKIPVMKLVYL